MRTSCSLHDGVIKWKPFPRNWTSVRRIHRLPVYSPHKGQCRRVLMFSLICTWTNGWVNNQDAGNLRPRRAYYNVTVMEHPFVSARWLRGGDILKLNSSSFTRWATDMQLTSCSVILFQKGPQLHCKCQSSIIFNVWSIARFATFFLCSCIFNVQLHQHLNIADMAHFPCQAVTIAYVEVCLWSGGPF